MSTQAVQVSPELKREALTVREKLSGITKIESAEQCAMVVEIGKACKEGRRKVEAFFKPLKQAQDAAKKVLLDAEKRELAEWEGPEETASKLVTSFRQEEERKARAERERQEAEARAQTEKDRLAAVDHALAKGDEAQAERLIEKPLEVDPVKVEAPKVEGIRRRKVWKFQVEDESLIPREFLSPDEKVIRAFVGAKKDLAKIPGVRIWSEDATDF